MQQALRQHDRAAFARSLVYPVGVNTNSGCSAEISDTAQFVAHYAEIVTPWLARAILATKPAPRFGHGAVFVAGDNVDNIWWPDTASRGFVFNATKLWSLSGLPCYDERPAELPPEFSRSWSVAFVCFPLPPEAGVPSIVARARHLELDLGRRAATLSMPNGVARDCRIDRISESKLDGRLPMSIQHCGQPSPEQALSIYLDCRSQGAPWGVQLYLSGQALVSIGDDNHVVVFHSEPPPASGIRE
jgi:hypothetical protein